MLLLSLHEFIGVNRDELIRRCEEKVAARSGPASTEGQTDPGVPLFLDQLLVELRDGPSQTAAINEGAARHGHDLLGQGFTVSQVVHDYGDVCQAVTDLAVETDAPISTEDFRTLNRCLDDAIAAAVTQHAGEQEVSRDRDANELRKLVNTAISAFEVLRAGRVGIAGSTGNVVHRILMDLRSAIDRPHAGIVAGHVDEHASVRQHVNRG